jgi:phosphinothricin acetyltransferase
VREGTATFELVPPDAAEMAARMRAIAEAGHPWIVAERASRVVGYAYAGPYRLRPAYRYTTEDSIYLAAEATRQGVGRRLLDALIAACERRGDRQMIAVIGDADNAASIAVHAAAGFAHVGVLRAAGRKFGRWIDVVLMQRALGEGAAVAPAEEPR